MRTLPLALVLSIASISPAASSASAAASASAASLSPAASSASAAASASAAPRKVTAHKARLHRHKPKANAPKVKVAPTDAPIPAVAPARAPARPGDCADTDLVPGPDNLDRVAAATLCLINQQRALAGLTELHRVAAIDSAATFHSVEMVVRNYVGEDGPGDSTPVRRLTQTGYVRPNAAVDVAENLAVTTGTASTPAATVATWMGSSGSRAVILSPTYTDTGIGVVAVAPAISGSGPGATYTEDFGVTS